MPQVINGCGTWYYGKKNLQTYHGRCGVCGKDGEMQSFDTTVYFVVFFIPVFPMGKKHIIDKCPHCSRHSALTEKQWKQVLEEEVGKAVKDCLAEPGNKDLAKAAIGKQTAYRYSPGFNELADAIKQFHSRDAEMLGFVGSMQAAMGFLDEAEQTLRQATAADPQNEAVREELAEVYIMMLKPQQAEPLLQHILDKGIPDKASCFFRLAGAYQAAGEHDKALHALDNCVLLVPSAEKEKDYRKMRRLSEKYLRSGKPVKPKWLAAGKKLELSGGADWSGALARIIPIGLLMTLVLVYLVSASWIGKNRKVYLVNGLSKPYTVSVNGEQCFLNPLTPRPVRTGEGVIELKPISGCNTIEPFTVGISTSFFARPFVTRTFIVNPDSVAVLAVRKTFYVPEDKSVSNLREPKLELFSNRQLHRFGRVDYLFEKFPKEITTSSHSSTSKTRLYVLGQDRDLSARECIALYSDVTSGEAAVANLKARLLHEPDDVQLIYLLKELADVNDFVESAAPQVASRPIRVHWHRAHQDCEDELGRSEKVEKEYLDLLETDPCNKTLLYLAGRVARNSSRHAELLNAAAAEPNPLPMALYALSYSYMSTADYKQALAMCRKASALDPNDDSYRAVLSNALMACGEWDQAVESLGKETAGSPDDPRRLMQRGFLLAMAHRVEEANKVMDLCLSSIYKSVAAPEKEKQRALLRAWVLYYSGSYEDAIAVWIEADDLWWQMEQAIEKGRMEEAEALKTQNSFDELTDNVLFYIGYLRSGQQEKAAGYLEKVIAELEKGRYESKRFAAALKTGDDRDYAELLQAPMDWTEKRVALLAMAFRFPERKDLYLDLALRLWYDGGPPVHFVKAFASGD